MLAPAKPSLRSRAMLLAVEAGFQAALMAPTQILAEQHYAVLRSLAGAARSQDLAFGRRSPGRERFSHLLSGTMKRAAYLHRTHALLYEGVSFDNLGLVVIDEQHKFGVSQRARLTAREPAPDVLVMTATPIPRTLTMTVYGDLDVSVIDEMPSNRGKIVTAVRDGSKLGEVLSFMRERTRSGTAGVRCLSVDRRKRKARREGGGGGIRTWRERLRPFRCELLHGRIPAPEKQAIMERFRRGETSALISTTVIEVGVDVPNATDHADRKRGALRTGPAASTARPDWPRRTQIVLHSPERGKVAGDGGETCACSRKPATDSRSRKRTGICADRAICSARRRAVCRRLKLGNLKTDMQLMRTRAGGSDRDLRMGSEAGSGGKSTFPEVDCRRTRDEPSRTLADEKSSQISAVCRPAKRGDFRALRLSPEAWRSEPRCASASRRRSTRSRRRRASNPKEVATLEALNRERRALVEQCHSVGGRVSRPRRRCRCVGSTGSIRSSSSNRNSRQFRNPNEEAMVQNSLGSGVIVSTEGHIITNNHVVDQVDEIEVQLSDGRTKKARLVGADATVDLAVLKMDEPGVKPLKFGDSDAVQAGDFVLAIGNPFGFEETVTDGIISSKGRPNRVDGFGDFLQTNAAINPGNSGGPLINLAGRNRSALIPRSFPEAAARKASGLRFLQTRSACALESLLKQGRIIRGYLGIQARNLQAGQIDR